VPWTHLRTAPTPFGEAAWAQAREVLARRGTDHATESEIAGAVEALLERAGHGPAKPGPAKRDRRVAARTRATAAPSWPRPADDGGPRPAASQGEQDELAAVIPLAVFDAREEAKKWW
jgi:hypothetical protein